MQIPTRNMEVWSANLIAECTADKNERLERGATFRNLYACGDPSGQAAIYNKTRDSIEDVCAYLCSSTDLRFGVAFKNGGSALQRAMCHPIANELLDQSRASGLDETYEAATEWSLVLGKTFVKHNWSTAGLEPHLIMPEAMGVYRPDVDSLDAQEAFVFSTYITVDQFRLLIKDNPNRDKIYKQVKQRMGVKQGDTGSPGQEAVMKQVILGGYQPYTGVGGIGSAQAQQARGIVQWLNGPFPTFDAKVLASLVRLDELWVKDDDRASRSGNREWTTIYGVNDIIIFGKEQRMNVFAEMYDPARVPGLSEPDEENPLAFKQPFVEFCPNPVKGYMWGRSEIANLALLQWSINNRVNGINKLLRLQEDPPVAFLGGMAKDDKTKAKLTKPGGWFHDPDPTAKAPTLLAPNLPPGLYESLQENERMFDVMTGLTPTLQGQASPSVRSHGQTGQLTTNATPRFKKKSMKIERSIQQSAALVFDLLKAKSTELLTAWVMPSDKMPPELAGKLVDPTVEPPAEGMKAYQFYMYEVPDNLRITVDAHSSSPAFGQETEEKAILLKKANAMTTQRFIEAINPADADTIIAEAQTAEINAARAAAQQQAVAAQQQGGKQKANGVG